MKTGAPSREVRRGDAPRGLCPRAGESYPVQLVHLGRPLSLQVRFSEELVKQLTARGETVDLVRAERVRPGQAPVPLFPARRDAYRRSFGREAPAWAVPRGEGLEALVVPEGKVTLTLTRHGELDLVYRDFRSAHATLVPLEREDRYKTEARSVPRARFEPERWEIRPLLPGVQVTARDPARIAAPLRRAFEEVCGQQSSVSKLKAQIGISPQAHDEARLEKIGIHAYLRQWSGRYRQLAAQAKGRGPRGREPALDPAALATWERRLSAGRSPGAAFEARAARLAALAKPVRIVVVPPGVALSDLPEAKVWASPPAEGTQGNVTIAPHLDADYVFIPEADLLGDQLTTRHELLHLVLEKYAGARTKAFFEREARRSPTLTRTYGAASHDERFATEFEAFNGSWGDDVRRRHQEENPRFAAGFSVLTTGRR